MRTIELRYLGMKGDSALAASKNGLPRKVQVYYEDLRQPIAQIYWALKPEGRLAIGVGDSTVNGKKILICSGSTSPSRCSESSESATPIPNGDRRYTLRGMLTSAVRAIGFDLDDTLCVYMPVAKQARWRTFEQFLVPHLNRSIEEIDQHYRHAFSEVLQAIHSEPWYSLYKREGHPTRTETMRRMLRRLGVDDADLAERLSWHYLSERERGLHLFEDALPMLNALKSRYPLFVITNGPAYEQRRELALLGLEPFFEVVAIEGEVGIGKPHPEIFRFVERTLSLPPESLLFVGNSWEHDVKGALGAGWHAIWLNREGLPHPEPETGVPAISDLSALLD